MFYWPRSVHPFCELASHLQVKLLGEVSRHFDEPRKKKF